MRPLFRIGLAAMLLLASSANAHSWGFAWFFSHSKPHGTCSGQHVVALTMVRGDEPRVAKRSIPVAIRPPIARCLSGRE